MEKPVVLFDYIQTLQANGRLSNPRYNDNTEQWELNGHNIPINDLPYNQIRRKLGSSGYKPLSSSNGSSFGEIYLEQNIIWAIRELGI
jgi:hypothetical protein